MLVLYFVFFAVPNAYCMEVTSAFGWRLHPIYNEMRFHSGIDIAANEGDLIPALFDGVAVWAGPRDGYGNCVILLHNNETYTVYAHCSSVNVIVNQLVLRNETIAYAGSTGISTGPHVHLEYWINGQYADPMTIWEKD